MLFNRAKAIDAQFVEFVRNWEHSDGPPPRRRPDEPIHGGELVTGRDVVELFESQMICRHQDLEAREMRARNEGFYTIGSAGHEGNAVVGRLTRHTDIAFLHYRSGAFMAERARKVPGQDMIYDTMLSFAASADDPISGGRHKVWGSVPLWVPPQTSTIASHLPKSVGAAIAIERARKLKLPLPIPYDSIVVCSFGDASVNHAVAQTAFNAASWTAHQRVPVPILFVCEDNGIGISVNTPPGWIETNMGARPHIRYFRANGLDLVEAYEVAAGAVEHCRRQRVPVFLHLRVIRMLGHAGSDAETEYHTLDEIAAVERDDPLLHTARLVLESGVMTAEGVLAMYEDVRQRVKQAGARAAQTPKLTSAEAVMRSLAPYTPERVEAEAVRTVPRDERVKLFGGDAKLPENAAPRHMAVLINQGLHDIVLKYPEAALFGEDVAKKGGVYHVTTGLLSKFGAARVFNTLLDETTILGLGIGAAHLGFLPIPEIQYLAYFHNAEDQIRGEACSLQYFSKAQYRNPMVIRIAGWAYQKGFGGHFHNDNSIAVLRDIPGLIVASPARGDDAVKMMRTCMALAKVDGRVVAFLEPIALYMTKDLHDAGDNGWCFSYPPPGEAIPLGEGCLYDPDGTRWLEAGVTAGRDAGGTADLTILTWSNGLYLSLRAAHILSRDHGIRARVVDLRWLNPLNEAFIVEQARATRRVLIVDEGRRSGGVSEAIMAILLEHGSRDWPVERITALDTYIPLGAAALKVLPSEQDVVEAARRLCTSSQAAEVPSEPLKRIRIGA